MADVEPTGSLASGPPPKIGSYRLVEPLGSGGMSSVFRAVHEETGHEVAVKILPRYLAKNATLLQRFMREAKSAEALEHPNVVAIYDRGSESGRYYLVLEYVPGGDLHDLVRDRGPMSVAEAVDAIRQVARGLKHAESRGLIHRDIKPANILRTPEGLVKVTDLGLALHTEMEDERVTRDGTTVGTVDYMAPEQARDSRAASVRSDIYSLGCTLYFLLTGGAPFSGGDIAEKLRSHAIEPAPDIRQNRRDAPELLARLVRKMMAKKPEKRYADYDDLLDALDAVAASIGAGVATPEKPAPLFALIDDEDEDDDLELPVAPSASVASAPLFALIDEDEDDESEEGFALGPGLGGSPASTAFAPSLRGPGRDEPPKEVDFSRLAELEEAAESLPTIRRPGSTAPGMSGLGPPPLEPLPEVEEIEEEAGPWTGAAPVEYLPEPEPGPAPIELLTGLMKLMLVAFALLGAFVGWSYFSPYFFDKPPDQVALPPELEGPGAGDPEAEARARAARWEEPADVEPPSRDQPPPPPEILARLAMPDILNEAPPIAEAPFLDIRRVHALPDRDHLNDLRRAFDTLGGTIDLTDDGPFFEDDLRMAGPRRVLRAHKGFRPIVVVSRSTSETIRNRPALIPLDGQKLFLDGIDLVVNGPDLGPRNGALFGCKGADLVLRDCTITVVGPLSHPFSVVQVGEPGRTPPPPCRGSGSRGP